MAELRKYGVSTSILFPLIERDVVDFEAGATFAAGDVQIIKDEGAAANTTNLPIHEGNGIYSLTLTASEMQAARIVVTIIDQTASKVWEDQAVLIETYGAASAQHAFDLDKATQDVTVSSITAGVVTAAAFATDALEAIADKVPDRPIANVPSTTSVAPNRYLYSSAPRRKSKISISLRAQASMASITSTEPRLIRRKPGSQPIW